jgi:arylsulfatase A-like enzyme
MMHAADWYATVLEAAGLPASILPPTAIDSIGQWDSIRNVAATGLRTTLVHHAYGPDGRGKIREGNWQLCECSRAPTCARSLLLSTSL